ncbi:MAG: Peptidase M29, aminopeptidase II [Microgenomates group bacterium GW2011_GWA2_44_7]|nr:MAG: Peptidase M29, aminopeptidase II [Microgenomates group bacterium GW2011_GWA2_44_7]
MELLNLKHRTNLRNRLINPLLNEKVGGSFHITPGKAYELTEVGGEKVNLDNGNRSSIHWDITILMLPQYGGGEIKIDGKTIQKNGRFLDPKLSVLNEGLTAK